MTTITVSRDWSRFRALSAAFCIFAAASLHAGTTYYLNKSEASQSYDSWTTLDYWSTTAGNTGDNNHPLSFSAEDEFVVTPHSGGFTLRTATGIYEWTGKSLRVGGEPHLNNSSLAVLRHQLRGDEVSLTYRNDGLVLGDRGRYYAYYGQSKPSHIYGTVTVDSANETYSAQLFSGYQEDAVLHFHDSFKSAANSRLRILATKRGFKVVLDDPSAYYGTIATTNTADNENDITLSLGNDFPGTLSLEGATTLVTSDGCTINSLSLGAGAVIDATAGAFSVTGSFANVSAVTVRVDSARFPGTIDLVSGKAGIFTVDDFVFTDENGAALDCDSLELVQTENGVAIRAAQYPTATLLSADSNSRTKENESSMTNSANWSNATAWPDRETMPGGWRYTLSSSGKYLRTSYSGTLSNPSGDITFPGLSLALPSSTVLLMLNPSFACANLILDGGSIYPSVYTQTRFAGKITVTENGGAVNSYIQRATFESEIEGTGNLRITATSGSGTQQPYGYVRLAGLNTNYVGAITATIPLYVPDDLVANTNRITPRFDRNYLHLIVSDKRNLGGPLGAVNPAALVLQNMSRLELAEDCQSLALDEPTRGIFINWVGRFLVDAGKSLTVASPLAVYGTMWKEGEGTLVLANPSPAFGADAAGSTPDADATNRTFRVAGGDVKIASADAVNGLDVVVENAASRIVIDLQSDNADFASFGIRNTKTLTPFAVDGDATEIPVLLYAAEPPAAEVVRGIFTVKSEAYDAVAALVEIAKPAELAGWKIFCEPRDNGDGTKTMRATVKRAGFILSIK